MAMPGTRVAVVNNCHASWSLPYPGPKTAKSSTQLQSPGMITMGAAVMVEVEVWPLSEEPGNSQPGLICQHWNHHTAHKQSVLQHMWRDESNVQVNTALVAGTCHMLLATSQSTGYMSNFRVQNMFRDLGNFPNPEPEPTVQFRSIPKPKP
ncbi:hypothetical protein EI94DRAFT_1710674 [Lactarius quietus]|nr:hypothetical protein EI94DRAFT_1710674 [Lactarius quietus]